MEPGRNFLLVLFVLSGVCNVLLVKWSNILKGQCSDGEWREFQHPVGQMALMFFSQFLCFVVYKTFYYCLQRRGDNSENVHFVTRGSPEISPLAFLLPSLLDAVASLLLFTGLYLTYASSFQVIRIAGIIFAGLYSSMYLNQVLLARHWLAFFTIACGITAIISIDMQRVYYDRASLPQDADENSVLTGNFLIVIASVFHAAQFVYEEKLVKSTDVPALLATGWQGVFGLAITAALSICMNYMPIPAPFGQNSRAVFDDVADTFSQLASNPLLFVALGLFVISNAFYQFAALNIVRIAATTNRLLADCVRLLLIWMVALQLQWEILNIVTLMGVVISYLGITHYRNAIFFEWYRSTLARLSRGRYADLNADADNNASAAGVSQAADVI